MTVPHYPEISGTPRQVLAGLWAEWSAEIAAALRERLSARLHDDRISAVLDLAPDIVSLMLESADGTQLLAEGPAREAASILRQARASHRFGAVVLRFSSGSVLQLDLSMPPAAPRHLREAVAFELERLSPIPPDRLYFDFHAAKATPEGRIPVSLRAIKRDVVDDAVALCRAAALPVAAVAFEDDPREANWRSFPIDRLAFLGRQWTRWGAGILAIAAVLLFIAALGGLYARGADQDAALQAQRDALSLRVAAMHRLEQRMADLRIQSQFPAAQKRAPLLLEALTQITQVLPDGTWLTEFSVENGKGHIIGFSKSPSDLIAEIDQSPLFANAQFNASLTGATSGTERFDLTFDIKRRAQP